MLCLDYGICEMYLLWGGAGESRVGVEGVELATRKDTVKISICHPTNKTNFSNVTLGDVSIWFSYQTPIAFQVGGTGFVIRHNEWGSTTGKHLAYMSPDKGRRIDGVTFEARLAEALAEYGVME